MDAIAEWEAALAATGAPRGEAVRIVNRERPGLREAMIAEFHRQGGREAVARDWQEQAVAAGYQ